MTTRFSTVLLLFVCVQNLAAAKVDCRNAEVTPSASAVYVSTAGKDTGSCGHDTATACRTIEQGISNCKAEGCAVFVRYGTYNTGKPLIVADGVSLYGSCIFDDETVYPYRSTIIGNPAIQADGIKKPTVIEGFVILGSAAAGASQASVAVAVTNSTGLVLRGNTIASGRGGNGSNGQTPARASGGSGENGAPTTGGEGGRACPSNPPAGVIGSGGKGATLRTITSSCDWFTGICTCGDRKGAPSPIGVSGVSAGSAAGGAGGGAGSPGCSCVVNRQVQNNAGNGSNGAPGQMGAGAMQGGVASPDTKGRFAGATWQPNIGGGAGTAGLIGGGGGGGGAGGFAATDAKGTNTNGYPAGGGGGGGCGGPGGTGGQQGGASVPLVLFASSIPVAAESNVLIPGPGGRGGDGGVGAQGGLGGSGGAGYQGPQKEHKARNAISLAQVCKGLVPGFGGNGGNGGQGGAGAGGAGGNGGPSFAAALVNSSSLPASGFFIYKAQRGLGGALGRGGQNAGASKAVDGQAGVDGLADANNPIVSFTSANSPTGANR